MIRLTEMQNGVETPRYSGGCGSKPLFHLLMADKAGLLEDGAAAGEDDEVRDAADLETGGELGVRLGVYLEDDRLSGHVGGGASDLGCGGPTGSAPVCPEVDEDGDGSVCNYIVEERGIDGERFGERGRSALQAPQRPVLLRCLAAMRFF